jgi:hypothetical protein
LQARVHDIGTIRSGSGGFGGAVQFQFGYAEFGAEGLVVADFVQDVQDGLGRAFDLAERCGFGGEKSVWLFSGFQRPAEGGEGLTRMPARSI